MSTMNTLAFCYGLPNINDITQGIIFVRNNIFYSYLTDYAMEACILNYINIRADKIEDLKKSLVGKTISVRVIRVDVLKGYIDVSIV
ncbi:SPV010 eIF2 alpha-like PKR inhibitor [Swinepox virus]|uniref:Protein K3 homolog n=3 Tax=Swinepox virus TaxID=10276 RepID=K3_SWPVK|nr:EIF2a-like PKR inhibitor [Swinepox virus]P32224.1 RecName: Full=Protein K3 homolog [Swinepox virus (STRAIN KASZA)]AAC37863.1 ORF C8L [Swinepox virus]AAL69749.1 SPV010 eIF2 alpha-like PKR inhibitor [Swinepox virus]QQG31501.1 eIF2 alpha-like PKR inhibitor [Swinepox virus]UED36673.1 EIF2a-like PKR inhibitor [Swinepox virus]UED36821.1 EIF2a-like PKR inhibitor [Swinepox virus]